LAKVSEEVANLLHDIVSDVDGSGFIMMLANGHVHSKKKTKSNVLLSVHMCVCPVFLNVIMVTIDKQCPMQPAFQSNSRYT